MSKSIAKPAAPTSSRQRANARRVAEQGIGIVFATSDLMEIMSAADRIIVMSRGLVTGDIECRVSTESVWAAALTMTSGYLTAQKAA